MAAKEHTLSILQRICFLSVLTLLSSTELFSQSRNQLYLDYIQQFHPIAVEQMHKYGIPASITLAQGLLESGGGQSDLALKGNNHFGIKCGGSWTGKTMTHDDDRNGECFRVYKSAEESYKDHSVFLQKTRYQRLFNYDSQDYKSWAKGLKDCGYATSPTYAKRLISIIELYQLYDYDRYEEPKDAVAQVSATETTPKTVDVVSADIPVVVYPNGIPYVIASKGETVHTFSQKFGISERKLRSYNDLPDDVELQEGDIVYFAKKKTKAAREFRKHCWHRIQPGESMYLISQMYGIRLKNLYKMNYKKADYIPQSGELLKIR